MKKFWALIFALIIVGGLTYLIYTGQYTMVIEAIQQMNKFWLSIGIMAIGFYWLLEAIILHESVSKLHKKVPFRKMLKVSMIGQFFSGITPFASGGQPAQLVILRKENIPLGVGTSVLMSKFVIYQSVLVFYALALLLLKSGMFLTHINQLFSLVFIGFSVNVIVISILIYFSVAKKSNHKLSDFLIKVLYKIRWIKNMDVVKSNVQRNIDEFHNNLEMMKQHKGLILKLIFLTIVQLTMFFVVPYCLYRGFGGTEASIINMIAATAFVLMVTSFVPMPGGSGGAEGGFYLIFGIFFMPQLILPALLLWRVITYYLWMFVGGLWMLTSKVRFARS